MTSMMDTLLILLPTGRWLAKQRERNSQTVGQLARALNRHPSTIRALERNNRVIPPGWSDDLRKLGLRLPATSWPSNMTPYFGSDLKRDLSTCVGFRHSRFWLSKQLCVPEEAVHAVIRGNLVVPHDWLLKLAELGANVPDLVRSTLNQPVAIKNPAPASPVLGLQGLYNPLEAKGPTTNPEPTKAEPQDLRSQESVGAHCEPPTSKSESSPPIDELPATKNPPRLSIKWSRERGLRIKFGTTFLDEVKNRLEQLLTTYQSGLHKASPRDETREAAESGRG